jgi:hypothetical protein
MSDAFMPHCSAFHPLARPAGPPIGQGEYPLVSFFE